MVVVGAGARRRVGSTVAGRVDASGGTWDAQCEVWYAGCDMACFCHHSCHPMCSFECRSESSVESSFECSWWRVVWRCRVRFRTCDMRCCMCDMRCCHFVISFVFLSVPSSVLPCIHSSRPSSIHSSIHSRVLMVLSRTVFTLKSGHTTRTSIQMQCKCSSLLYIPQR